MYLRRLATAVLVLLVSACGGGGGGESLPPPSPLGPADTANYMPFATGLRWLNSDGRLVRVEGPDAEAGPGAWRLVGMLPDSVARQSYRVSASAIEFLGSRSTDATQRAIGDFVLLRLPVRLGDSWLAYERVVDGLVDVDGDGRPDRLSTRAVTTVLAYEPIEVAAGRFERALRVRTEDRQTARLASTGAEISATVSTDDWYVADLGRVLSISAQGTIILNRVELQGYRIGSRSTDTEAPTIRAFNPQPDRIVNMPIVRIEFSELMDTVGEGPLVSVVGSDGVVRPGRASWFAQQFLTFELDQPLPPDTYRITLEPGLTDRLGNPVGEGRSWRATIDTRGPTLLSLSPAAGAAGVGIDSPVEVVLDEPTAWIDLRLYEEQTGLALSGAVTGSGRTWRFVPDRPLRRAARYRVVLAATDLALNVGAQSLTFFETERGRFLATSSPSDRMDGLHIEAGDVDADGRADAVVLHQIPSSFETEFLLFRQRPDGRFDNNRIATTTASYTDRFELVDLDGDGLFDVLPFSGREWWRRLVSGGYERRVLYEALNFLEAESLQSAGGRRDVVGLYNSRPYVMRQIASGVFDPPSPLGTPFGGYLNVVGDVDGDGLDDIILHTVDGATAYLLVQYQSPDGSFGRRQLLPYDAQLDRGAHSLRVVDIDRNGLPDLVLTAPVPVVGISLQVIRQTAPGVFTRDAGIVAGGLWLEVADVDADGRLDIVAGSFGQIGLHLQQPDGRIAAAEIYYDLRYASGASSGAFAIADFDGDGRLDIWAGGTLWLQRPPTSSPGSAAPAGPAAAGVLRWQPGAR